MALRVILNPRAGHGRASRFHEALRSAFAEHGVLAELVTSRAPGHARELARQAALEAVDGVVAAGGDGTLFEVVNGLAEVPPGQRPPLGLVPLGTGNAFARELDLAPEDWRAAVTLICDGGSRPVDLARADHADGSFHFINIVGCGFVVDAGRLAQHLKWLGAAAYHGGVLMALPRLRAHELEIEVDGHVEQCAASLVTVSNSRYTGTDFLVAPGARLDDGLLDLMLVGPVTRRRILQVLPAVRDGRHLDEPEVRVMRGRRISLRSPEGMALAPDGEFIGALPVTIECLPGALALFAGAA